VTMATTVPTAAIGISTPPLRDTARRCACRLPGTRCGRGDKAVLPSAERARAVAGSQAAANTGQRAWSAAGCTDEAAPAGGAGSLPIR
jgi:hypothetical protein